MKPDIVAISKNARDLADRLNARSARVGVIGLGYVGLPLAVASARRGFATLGFDIDPEKIGLISSGSSYIEAVAHDELKALATAKTLSATADFSRLGECDVVIICVPTPLSKQREPDLSYVVATTEQIANNLRSGQLVALESTTYPGTTLEVLKPILESTGLVAGGDFWIGFSPEREDPGNARFNTATIPKIVAGDGSDAAQLMEIFYGAVVDQVVVVSDTTTAEAVKITENVFRAVNIALVNELKIIFDAMGVDVWEVIDAASTKPFGFMPFYPGPGLGGHCIPIDPFYLTWKSREFGLPTRFIELAGEINLSMPRHVIGRLEQALDRYLQLSLSRANILVLGLAYKKNVSDIRESPSFALIELLEARGASVTYHDPHAPVVPPTREHSHLAGRQSAPLTADTLAICDAVLVSTDHDDVDYALVGQHAKLIVDTRNVFARKGIEARCLVKA
jgi:UDP-N-acetyl-D-glucosamine dehydrogenase